MPKKPKIFRTAIGDVFTIPLNDNEVVIGQTCAKRGRDFALVAVFKDRFSSCAIPANQELRNVVSSEPILLASTFDMRVAEGKWRVIDRIAPMKALKMPAFRVDWGFPIAIRIESYDMRRRWANPRQWKAPSEYTVSEAWLEEAIKSYFGGREWLERFNKVLYKNLVSF